MCVCVLVFYSIVCVVSQWLLLLSLLLLCCCSYRKLAIKYHPDKNPSDTAQAEENFKVVGEAYNVLSNKDTRQICTCCFVFDA